MLSILCFTTYFIFMYTVLSRLINTCVDRNWIRWYMVRLSPMFTLCRGKISQYPSTKMKSEMKKLKKKERNLPFRVSRLLGEDVFFGMFSIELKPGSIYYTNTHMLSSLKRAEKKGYITILSVKPGIKRLLFESRTFFSTSYIIKNRKKLTKQFYKIKFKYHITHENGEQ